MDTLELHFFESGIIFFLLPLPKRKKKRCNYCFPFFWLSPAAVPVCLQSKAKDRTPIITRVKDAISCQRTASLILTGLHPQSLSQALTTSRWHCSHPPLVKSLNFKLNSKTNRNKSYKVRSKYSNKNFNKNLL